jgi:hypothetical protein
MNSSTLIDLHREKYPESHLTPTRLYPMIYELMYLTRDVEEPFRKTLVKGTLLELIARNYAFKEADDLREKLEKDFDHIYDNECCLCFLWLCT